MVDSRSDQKKGREPMASIHPDKRTGIYQIRFRLGGEQVMRSLKTRDPLEAEVFRAEATLQLRRINSRGLPGRHDARLIQRLVDHSFDPGEYRSPDPNTQSLEAITPVTSAGGPPYMRTECSLQLPTDFDRERIIQGIIETNPGIPGGEPTSLVPVRTRKTLAEVFDAYHANRDAAATTIGSEKTHFGHLKRILAANTLLDSLSLEDLQKYANTRLGEKYGGKPVQATTVRKEFRTLSTVCKWAARSPREWCSGSLPLDEVRLPRQEAEEPWRTFAETRRLLTEHKFDHEREEAIWGRTFLTLGDMNETLRILTERAQYIYVVPFYATVLFSGARTSEVVKSHHSDWDLEGATVLVTAMKGRGKGRKGVVRRLPIHSAFLPILRSYSEWRCKHQKLKQMFLRPGDVPRSRSNRGKVVPVTTNMIRGQLKRAFRNTEYEPLAGRLHAVRHGVSSALRDVGVDQRDIDAIVGHRKGTTSEIYSHAYIERLREAIELLEFKPA